VENIFDVSPDKRTVQGAVFDEENEKSSSDVGASGETRPLGSPKS
jgi:hypothetical protein